MRDILKALETTHESLLDEPSIFDIQEQSTREVFEHDDGYPVITDEFWTSKQRQASSIHEVSYRACFKPQLPNFFINLFTEPGDIVYDPFSGRGTTAVEAALCKRNVIFNDINPLSGIFTLPRIKIPPLELIEKRVASLGFEKGLKADIDLSMFYHEDTLSEIVSLRNYLIERKERAVIDEIDDWIRMVATNRLTGHSKNFFSVYTLPPNQACSPEKQLAFNQKRNQVPPYKNVKEIILKKTYDLFKDIRPDTRKYMYEIGEKAVFLNRDAAKTDAIPDASVSLVVTSPPFLDVIDYAGDNWLRCWFNNIDIGQVEQSIVVTNKLDKWEAFIGGVLHELYRMLKPGGFVAFEVGEIRKGTIKLENSVVPLAKKAGFTVLAVLINKQQFTKTSNIWGVTNNSKGTNSNRIVLFHKSGGGKAKYYDKIQP